MEHTHRSIDGAGKLGAEICKFSVDLSLCVVGVCEACYVYDCQRALSLVIIDVIILLSALFEKMKQTDGSEYNLH